VRASRLLVAALRDPESVAGLTPDGTVDMNEVQVAYIGNAGGGNGTLYYQGQPYPFRIAGLGVGGIGASTVDAEGEVLDVLVQSKRNKHAALKLMRKLLKKYAIVPERMCSSWHLI